MPTFHVTDPSGATYEVNAPDGATEQDALAYVQKNGSNQAAPPSQAPSAPARLGPPQPLSFAEKYIAPALESVVGSNPQGSPAGRAIQGAADPMLGITQLAAHALPGGAGAAYDQKIGNLEQQYQGQRAMAGSTGFDPMRFAGNMGTAFLAPGTSAASAASLPIRMLRGGLTGAAYNLAQPVTDTQSAPDYGTEKLKQGGLGFGVGALGVPIASGLARIVSPAIGADQQKLMQSGVTLTPGQTMGGVTQRVEDSLTSVPVLGDLIRNAKNRTLADMNRAVYARALDPVAPVRQSLGLPVVSPKALPSGPDGVLAVKNALGETYDALLPQLRFDVRSIAPQLAQLRQMAGQLPQKEAAQFGAILDKNLGQLSGGVADGQTFKTITSNLGTEAKNFASSSDGYQRNLADALTQAQALFRQGLKTSNPTQAPLLDAIDKGYGNYTILRRAASSAGDKSNGITPAQLSGAVRAQDRSVGKGATATGVARMQDLSNAARAVLPTTVADSGTPIRSAVGLGLAGLLGHAALPPVAAGLLAPAAGVGGLLAAPYTRLGQAGMQKILAERPDWAPALAKLLRRSGPLLAATAPSALLPILPNGT